MSLSSGTRLGPFEIRDRIDLPGFGEIYAARDHANHRDVAMHVLRTNAMQDEEVRDQFEQDVRAAAARIQPDPLTIHLIGVDPQAIYVVSDPIRPSPVPFTPVPTPRAADVVQRDAHAPRRAWVAAAVVAIAAMAAAMFMIGGDEETAEQASTQATSGTDTPAAPAPAPAPERELLPPEMTEVRDYVVTPSRPRARARTPRTPSRQAVPARSVRPAAAAKPSVSSRDTRDTSTPLTAAALRASEFDLEGALALLESAGRRGDAFARMAASYVRGLIAARAAFPEGGDPKALAPVRESIMALAEISRGRPGAAEIARLVLQAAAAAAQSERDEMRLYIESAVRMEEVQLAAGQGGAPIVPAAEVAGDLWLQVHRYDEARRAFMEAETRIGSTPRVLSGLARSAQRLNDTSAACTAYRRLIDAWGSRPESPPEIAAARAYLGGCSR